MRSARAAWSAVRDHDGGAGRVSWLMAWFTVAGGRSSARWPRRAAGCGVGQLRPASAMSWRWPATGAAALGDLVIVTAGQPMIMSCAPVARAAASTSASLASDWAYAIESLTVPGEEVRTLAGRRPAVPVAGQIVGPHVDAVDQDVPPVSRRTGR